MENLGDMVQAEMKGTEVKSILDNPKDTMYRVVTDEELKRTAELSKDTKLSNDTMKFNSDLDKRLDTFFNIINELDGKRAELKADRKADKITDTVLKEKLKDLELKEIVECGASIDEVSQDIERFRERYIEHTKPKGEDVNDMDLKLIQSGIQLSKDELQGMANTYNKASNFTMLRILKDYARDRGHHIYIKDVVSDQDFNILKDRIISGMKKEGYNRIMFSTPNHRFERLEQFRSMF